MSEEYPSEEILKKIEEHPSDDFHGFMKLVHDEWAFADWGWTQEGDVYRISTGGWSGNEDLIEAMQKNFIFWVMYWQESRRGGHYVFCPIREVIK